MATESEIGKKKLTFSNTVHYNDQNKYFRNATNIDLSQEGKDVILSEVGAPGANMC